LDDNYYRRFVRVAADRVAVRHPAVFVQLQRFAVKFLGYKVAVIHLWGDFLLKKPALRVK